MKIIIDEREHDLMNACKSLCDSYPNIQLEKRVLPLGDILISDMVVGEGGGGVAEKEYILIERKTINDLLASIKDGRYKEQSFRLINSAGATLPSPHCVHYLIEGIIPAGKRNLVFSTMTSLRFGKGFGVLRTATVVETAELLFVMTDKIMRDRKKGVSFVLFTPQQQQQRAEKDIKQHNEGGGVEGEGEGEGGGETNEGGGGAEGGNELHYCSAIKKEKKKNINKNNIGEILLCQIPSINHVSAIAIMKEFNGSIETMIAKMRESPDALNHIIIGEKRKLGKNAITILYEFFC